jgi:hypothetical protein
MANMLKPIEIAGSRLQKDPELLWKTFVKFLSKSDTTQMNDIQMAAQLPFWYDFDIQKGGHFYYFESKYEKLGAKLNVLILATLDALKIIGADKQAEILAKAADVYTCKPRRHPKDADEIAQIGLEGEFEKFDTEYNQTTPEIKDWLEKYLMDHKDNFVKVV